MSASAPPRAFAYAVSHASSSCSGAGADDSFRGRVASVACCLMLHSSASDGARPYLTWNAPTRRSISGPILARRLEKKSFSFYSTPATSNSLPSARAVR